MAARYEQSDLFADHHDYVAHGVNVYGVMGAGIAPVMAKAYPGLLDAYRTYLRMVGRNLAPGTCFTYQCGSGTVLNLFSQDRPGPHARLEWLDESLRQAMSHMQIGECIHMPWIGAGIGGLDLRDVALVLREASDDFGVDVVVHARAVDPYDQHAVEILEGRR